MDPFVYVLSEPLGIGLSCPLRIACTGFFGVVPFFSVAWPLDTAEMELSVGRIVLLLRLCLLCSGLALSRRGPVAEPGSWEEDLRLLLRF